MECLQVRRWGGELHQTEVEVPEPADDEVLIRVEAASVGLTVRNAINGDLGDDASFLPRIPGHEIVGTVAAVGSSAVPLAEGDAVAAYFYLICGRCDACLSARESLCERFEGFIGVHVDGGYAEYVTLPARSVVSIPSSLDWVAASAIPDAIATTYHVVTQRANVSTGDDVMVLGAGGGVGIHLVQMADYYGAAVTAVDVSSEKLRACRDAGAEHTVNTDTETLADHQADLDAEYDVVVDFTGSMVLLEESISLLAPRGRLVNLTGFPGRSFELSPRQQTLGELEVVGSRYCSRYELRRAAELVDDGVISPVVSSIVGLDGVDDLLGSIEAGEVVGRGALRL